MAVAHVQADWAPVRSVVEEASALLPRDQLCPSTSVQTLAFWLVITIYLMVRALWVEAEVPPAEWSSVVSLGNKSSKMGLRKVGEGTPTSLPLDFMLWMSGSDFGFQPLVGRVRLG